MPLPALAELPQLTALSLAWRRLVDLKPVLMLVNNTSLVCCWEQRGRWQQRGVGWPEGVCRDGVPLQREAVGELIADLIFDCDCPGAELVLCLPLQVASWCVVHGYGSDGSPDLLPHALQSVDLLFELVRGWRVVVGLLEDPRPAGRRAPDPHRPGGSSGSSAAAATRSSRFPALPVARQATVLTAALGLASAVVHAGGVSELYRESGWASTCAMAATAKQPPQG